MQPVVVLAAILIVVTALPYVSYLALYAVVRPRGVAAAKRPIEPGTEPTVSVVLPTYNEADLIERKLEELCALSYPTDRLEIVVVDDSNDGTADRAETVLAEYPALESLVIRRTERTGVAAAVNQGVAAASGEYVLRTDVDSELAANTVEEAVATLQDPNVGGVTGRQTAVIGGSNVEAEYRDLLARLQALESWLDSTFIAHGPCFVFKREAYRPIATDSLADDTEIAVRLRRAGHRVVMDPSLRFAEAGASGFRARRTRKDRRAMGLIKLLIEHRDALGGYGRYGRIVLPFNWWFMILTPWLLVFGTIIVTAAMVSLIGLAGLLVPLVLLVGGFLGSRDLLGPLQAAWSFLDAQASLLVAALRLARGGVEGTWEPDRDSREVFE